MKRIIFIKIVKNKIYLELDIEGEKNAFLLSEIRNIKKIVVIVVGPVEKWISGRRPQN